MIASLAAATLALHFAGPLSEITASEITAPTFQTVQYGRVPVRRPPCGHGWDISARDGLCYPTGYLAPQDQAARRYQRYHRGGGYHRYDDDYFERPGRRYYRHY